MVLGVVPANFDVSRKYLMVLAAVVVTLQHEAVDALVQLYVRTFVQANAPRGLGGIRHSCAFTS